MKNELPEDILEGKRKLEKAERHINDSDKFSRLFLDGISYLNDALIDEDHSSSNCKLINNLKATYIKKLLENLPTLKIDDFSSWCNYLYILLSLEISNEIEDIYETNPQLRNNRNSFCELYKDVAEYYVQQNSNSNTVHS